MNTTPNTQAAVDDENTIDGTIVVKPVDNALAVLNPTQFATELFQPFQDRLTQAKRRATAAKYDITTKDGMAKAKELRASFVKIRTEADDAKSEAKRPIDESGKLILAHFRKIEEAAKAEEKKHADAIAAEEKRLADEKQRKLDQERERVERLQGMVDTIRMFPSTLQGASSDDVRAAVDAWADKSISKAEYQDHFEDAVIALETMVTELRGMLAGALAREEAERKAKEDREELERLRAEQAKRDAEAAERQRLADKAAAESARQAQRASMIADNMAKITNAPIRAVGCTSAQQIADLSEELLRLDFSEESFGDRLAEAKTAASSVQIVLTSLHDAAVARENKAAEAEAIAQAADEARRLEEAHVEALEEDAERAAIAGQAIRTEAAMIALANLTPIEEDHSGRIVGAALVSAGQPGPDAPIVQSIDAMPGYIDQDKIPAQLPRRLAAAQLQPSDDEIIGTLAGYYGQSRATVAAWLIGMDLDQLRAIAAESAE